MRLIDVDLLIKALEKTKANSTHYPDKVLCDFSMEMVKNMPIAYNVDAVVEELEELKEDCFEIAQLVAYDKAIEIVRNGGGKNE